MADSIFKQWDDKIDGKYKDDFKQGVLAAIQELKKEVYSLKVDNVNQLMGRVIRDDKRIVLSAPEIVIGDVNLGGMLNPGTGSKVIIRGNEVSLQGAGNVGKIGMRAPEIEQIAENPGIDGNEHVVGDVSKIVSQATNITIQSDQAEAGGALPEVESMTGGGIKLHTDHELNISATESLKKRKTQIDNRISQLESAKGSIDRNVETARDAFKEQCKEIDELLDKKAKLSKDDDAVRTDYQDEDELNMRIEELSSSLTEAIYKYYNLMSLQGEHARLLKFFKDRKDALASKTADDFKKNSTKTSVNIASEIVNIASMDGDNNIRTNASAGVKVTANTMKVVGDFDDQGSLPESNKLEVNMRNVEISTAGQNGVQQDEHGVISKAEYKAEGDVVIRSKNIILETMDYEVADSKKKEKALTADSTIKIRSKNINVSTANSKDVEVDENGKITKATYTSEGDIMVNSKNFTVAAIDWEVNNGEQKEKALTSGGSFTVRTEKNDISATDTEGKATGKVSINAKAVDVKAVDVDKSSRADKDAAQGGALNVNAETINVTAKTEEAKVKKVHEVSDEVKIEAPVEITKELKTPKGTIDKLDVGQKFKSPNISDGM